MLYTRHLVSRPRFDERLIIFDTFSPTEQRKQNLFCLPLNDLKLFCAKFDISRIRDAL